MKPELGASFDSKWEGIPPAIPSGDLEIWLRYRPLIAEAFEHVYFNVRVGEPVPVAEDLPSEIKFMAEAVSRRRIDVVGETKDSWHLIELKYNAGAEALGQILMYKALWKIDPPDDRLVKTVIVSDRANKDLALSCRVYGVELVVV